MNNTEPRYVVVNTSLNVRHGHPYGPQEYPVIGDRHAALATLEEAVETAADYNYLDLTEGEAVIYSLVPVKLTPELKSAYVSKCNEHHIYRELHKQERTKRMISSVN